MNRRDLLLRRLDDIGRSLADSGHGLALIGLGSAGIETERMDEYSDLDFFAMVETGFKQRYLQNLDWLNAIVPLAYQFRNTADGYKVFFSDNIYCEFAVFEPAELAHVSFAPGRIVWKRADMDSSMACPVMESPAQKRNNLDWQLGEALTNLYVGICRYCRGEKLAAARLVQQCAVDRILEMAELRGSTFVRFKDPFAPDRRIEQRNAEVAVRLSEFVQGYQCTPQSTQAILDYLDQEYSINQAMAAEIRRLCLLARNTDDRARKTEPFVQQLPATLDITDAQ